MEEFNLSLLLVVIVTIMTSLIMITTLAVFIYIKMRRDSFNKRLLPQYDVIMPHYNEYNNDDLLYMMDFDEISIKSGKLQLDYEKLI